MKPVQKAENTAVGIRHADHVAPCIRKKLALTLPTSGCRPVGIFRSRTQATAFYLQLNGLILSCRMSTVNLLILKMPTTKVQIAAFFILPHGPRLVLISGAHVEVY
jgi:hypothetical protein